MILDKKFTDFLEELSSAEPVPGGGVASATVGTLAVALGSMVANLTIGKKRYAQHEEDIRRILKDSQVLMQEFARLAEEDAKAFEPLAQAYGLPRETEEEKAYKDKVMEEVLYGASLSPLHIMEKVEEAIDLLEEIAEKGSRIAISDVGTGAVFAQGALKGAALNVFINTRLMKNRERARKLNEKANEMLDDGVLRTNAIFILMRERLCAE